MSLRKIIDNQYEILRQIKTGGFGTIYYGWDITLDRPVAIKEVAQSLLGDKQYMDMFVDEALNTARLNHPNIVQIYSLRRTSENNLYIIMQFVEGIDLRDLIEYFIDRGGRVPENLAVFIIGEICKALEYAHNLKDRRTGQSLNIVHRDISPSNIMLSVEGAVNLIDFGIAKARHRVAQKTQTGFVKGKVAYLSPEQLEGKDATRQSDIFSLGTVFYELLTGCQAFEGDSDFSIMKNIMSGRIDFHRLNDQDFTPELCKIVKKSLARDTADRYKTANEMYVDLYELTRKHYPGEPMSDLSRLVHEIHIGEDTVPESKPAASRPEEKKKDQQNIKTQVLSAGDNPFAEASEPEQKQEAKSEPEDLKADHPKQKRSPEPSQPGPGEEAKTQIFDSEEARTVVHDTSGAEARTVIHDTSRAGAKSGRGGFNFNSIAANFKRVDSRVWIYAGGALGILILILILALLLRGGGESGPVGDYRIWINSAPEGAEVYINDQLYGKTPLQLSDIDNGEYELRLNHPQADPVDTQFILTEGSQVTFPNFILTREVYVNSIPQGARVYVNSSETDLITPALVDVPIMDSVNLKLEHDNSRYPVKLSGFDAESGEFKADDDYIWEKNFNEEANRWELTGRFLKEITISSKPQGADVLIEGRETPIGQTPGKMMIPFGSSKLTLVKAGFETKIRTVNIAADFKGSLFYEMFRQVRIGAVDKSNSNGPDLGATVYKIESEGKVSQVDEKTPAQMLLSGVEHRIYLAKDGYRDTSLIIGVNQNELVAKMTSKSETQPNNQPVAQKPEEDKDKAELLFIFTDRKSKEPLEGVDVVAEEKDTRERILLGTTNSEGRLEVRLVEGKYKFIASKDGYREWDDGEKISKGKKYKYKKKLRRD